MAENTRAPVAIRIVRPYATEEELFANELETLGKTSVVLIGAHPRPTGVILRFEVTLANGDTVLRGEGRVLAHKENAFRGQAGLTLRFTRLDPKSKSVVDRATALREARAGGEPTPSRPSPPLADSPVADALTQSTPAPSATAARPSDDRADSSAKANADQEAAVASARASAREKANATARANAKRTGTGRPSALTPPPVPVAAAAYEPEPEPEPTQSPEPTPVTSIPGDVAPVSFATHASTEPPAGPGPGPGPEPDPEPEPEPEPVRMQPAAAPGPPPAHDLASRERTPGPAGPLAAPPDRAELLARLRERAGKLPPDRVEAILTARR